MYPFKWVPLKKLVLTPAADAGIRREVKIDQNSFTYRLFAKVTTRFNITTAAATAILNRGSASAALDFMGVNENGIDRVLATPLPLVYLANMDAMSAPSRTPLASKAIAANASLTEWVPITFASPQQRRPQDTAFREKDPTAPTTVFFQLSNNAASRIAVAGGGGTVSVTDVTIEIVQLHNRNQKHMPLYVPFIREVSSIVAGASEHFEIPLQSDKTLSRIVIGAETSTKGLVNDVINAVGIRSDVRDYVQPQIPFELFGRLAEANHGGETYVTAAANELGAGSANPLMAGFSFVDHGRLSTTIEPAETNLRLDLDVQPSILGGDTRVRVTLVELVRDVATYPGPMGTGRRVTAQGPLPWITARQQ